MSEIKYVGKNILNHDLIVRKGNVSGSAESTGSFGHVLGHSVETALDSGISSPADGQLLTYTGSLGKWVNKSLSAETIGFGLKHKHTQSSANVTWTITHNFGFQYPNIDVYDSNDKLVIPTEVTATSSNVLTVTFDSAVAGIATLSTGGSATAGGRAYKHIQSSANTTWTVSHNLEYQYPAVTVYDGNDDIVIPQRIRATNANTLTLTFTEAESGFAHASIGGGLPDVTSNNAGKYLRVNPAGAGVEWTARNEFSGSSSFTGSLEVTGSFDADGIASAHQLSQSLATWPRNNTIGIDTTLISGSVSLTVADSVTVGLGKTMTVEDGARWLVVPPSFFVE